MNRRKFLSMSLAGGAVALSAREQQGTTTALSASDIDQAEKLADEFIYKLLHTDLDKLVQIKELNNYTFKPNSDVSAFTKRSDIVNKNVSRS